MNGLFVGRDQYGRNIRGQVGLWNMLWQIRMGGGEGPILLTVQTPLYDPLSLNKDNNNIIIIVIIIITIIAILIKKIIILIIIIMSGLP